MGVKYSTNWVLCFADDLWEGAQWLEDKATLTGQGKTQATKYPYVPASTPLYKNSRVTIFGHGNPGSTQISGNGNKWEASAFAELIRGLLGYKVKRISFHMCYGGKATDGTIHSSFVHKFASYCDFAEEIVGRTSVTNMMRATEDGKTTRVWREVNDTKKLSGGKVLYKPKGGILETAVAPSVFIINYDD